MKDEETDKKVWQTPEVVDLDVNKDTTKIPFGVETGADSFGPS